MTTTKVSPPSPDPAPRASEPQAVTGRLAGITLPGLLQLLHLERTTCLVTVTGATGGTGWHGEVHVRDGELVHAVLGELLGEPAAHALCAGGNAEIEISGLLPEAAPTIRRPLEHVLLEGAKLADESRRGMEEPMLMEAEMHPRPNGRAGGALYTVRDGALVGPRGAALRDLRLALPDGAVTVLLGPVGTGKSLLLRALAGQPLPSGWHRRGSWRRRGHELNGTPGDEILWLPQVERRDLLDTIERHELVRAVLGLVHWSSGTCLLLDDPTLESINAPLPEILRACAGDGGGAVLVTHDLGLAREVADYVVLLSAGRVVAQGAAPAFFEAPPNELARSFVATGN